MEPRKDTEALESELVLEAIYARYGYDLRGYDASVMRRRLAAVLAASGVAHLGELQHRVLTEPEFFHSLMNTLMVRVSAMFRDPVYYRMFRERVVPVLRTYPELKIWHAGCASGEEVYSSAILLFEEDLYERTQIYATDVSASALEEAQQGVYPQSALPAFVSNYEQAGGKRRLNDYYTALHERFTINERLRKNVVFFQHDLSTDYALGEMHVVVCRNVFIYFGTALRERVALMFADSICRGGFLCLGGSERLESPASERFDEFSAHERIYRRRGHS